MVRHLLSIKDLKKEEMTDLLNLAIQMKKTPQKYNEVLKHKSLLMLFEKPSLRTRISFEVGMTQLGGHAVYYDVGTSPLGKGKETVEDTAQTACRYVDIIMARVFEHENLERMAKVSRVPIINALSNFSHPCQILADMQTILEKKNTLKFKLAYLGDSNNNVTNSLLFAGAIMGFDVSVGCPPSPEFAPSKEVMDFVNTTAKNNHAKMEVTSDATKAVHGADVIYTDSWMSYHIKPAEKDARLNALKPYQVTASLMSQAKPDAIFMHCLPATRGEEVTAQVLDGPQSVVFDQAENRLHIQKAIMATLLK